MSKFTDILVLPTTEPIQPLTPAEKEQARNENARLTCKYTQTDDSIFNFDFIQEYELHMPNLLDCHQHYEQYKPEKSNLDDFLASSDDESAPLMTRCRCDDSPTEYITCCTCGFVECEYYCYRYKSSSYCNRCALDVCGIRIEKPKSSFNILSTDSPQTKCPQTKLPQTKCDQCFDTVSCEDVNWRDDGFLCQRCANRAEMLDKYSQEEEIQLIKYCIQNNITIEQAIEYQTHCHCCGKYLENAVIDEQNHQYCNERCFEACEDYSYPCFRKGDCRVCQIWQYQQDRFEQNY